MKIVYAIAAVTALLVLILAVGAFVLSYHALRDLAQQNGVRSDLSWMFPVIVDGFIVVASLSVLRGSLMSEGVKFPWLLTGMFVILSTWLNVEHGGRDNWLSGVIRAVPPVALFLSLELLMSQVRSSVRRFDAAVSLTELQRQFERRRDKLARQISDIETQHQHVLSLAEQARQRHDVKLSELRQERDRLRAEIVRLSEECDDLSQGGDRRLSRIEARRDRVRQLAADGLAVSDIAGKAGVSERTVYRDFEELGIVVDTMSENGRDR